MRSIVFRPNNPHIVYAAIESIESDTLLFIEAPDHVFIGLRCNVTKWVNPDTSLPIVRGCVLGNSFLFDNGKNLWIVLATKKQTTEETLQKILINALEKCGIKSYISSNDILHDDRQLGMTAPPVEYTTWVTSAIMNMDADTEKITRVVVSPHEKWADKPQENIADWVKGIISIKPIEIDDFIDIIKSTASAELNVTLTNGKFTRRELSEMTRIKPIYESEKWQRFGEW
jgi:lipoate-protein ligase A